MSNKSEFRNACLKDPELLQHDDIIPRPIISSKEYLRKVNASVQLVDFIVWLKGVTGERVENGIKRRLTAREVAGMLAQSVRTLLNRRKVVILVVDKKNVPITKGVVQNERTESSMGTTRSARAAYVEQQMPADALDADRFKRLPLSVTQNIPAGMSFSEAVDACLIPDEYLEHALAPELRRAKSLQLHQRHVQTAMEQRAQTRSELTMLHSDIPRRALDIQPVDIAELDVVQRALVAVADTPIPMPWHEFLSKHRAECLRYFMRAFMFDPDVHVCPPRGRRLLFDGHQMSYDHHPCRGEASNNKPRAVADQENEPLVLRHPLDHETLEQNAVVLGRAAVTTTTVDDGESMYDDGRTDVVEYVDVSDATGLNTSPYPLVSAAPQLRNDLGEADFAIFHYILQLLKNNPTLPPVIEISSVDSDLFLMSLWFLYKWQHDMFHPHASTKGQPLPELFLTSGSGWASAGTKAVEGDATKSGSVNMTAMYLRIIRFRLNGNVHLLPSLLYAVTCAGGDYTMGYPYVGTMRFAKAFYDYHTIEIQCRSASDNTVEAAQLPMLVPLLVHRHKVHGDARSGITCVADYQAYRRLVHCVYFDVFAAAVRKYGIDKPHLIRPDTLRAIVTQTAVKKAEHLPYLVDPKRVPETWGELTSFMTASLKRMPPEKHIKYRFMAVWLLWLLMDDLGHPSLTALQYDPLQMGFKRIDKNRPLSKNNIRFAAKKDFEQRHATWFKLHGVAPSGPILPDAGDDAYARRDDAGEGVCQVQL